VSVNNPLYGWQPVYRLYYQSVHWITAVEEGPDGKSWYQLSDESDDNLKYYLPQSHVRLIKADELTPISPEIPWEHKRIVVNLTLQDMKVFEYDQVVLHTLISSGIPGIGGNGPIPTSTPTGRFNIQVKMPSKHMGDGRITDRIDAYELPGVPWVCFFTDTGVAFHGTYWHHNFGRRMSHGCVNMSMKEAKWLYRWALPESEFYTWEKRGYGTQVTVTA
ncbi:MAG: L,D-transpeptidase, partial [Anaerolineales bacterium]|nr:L,D-transpeptidase [Anaerolineales bacterium]